MRLNNGEVWLSCPPLYLDFLHIFTFSPLQNKIYFRPQKILSLTCKTVPSTEECPITNILFGSDMAVVFPSTFTTTTCDCVLDMK